MKLELSTALLLVGLMFALASGLAAATSPPKPAAGAPAIGGEKFVKRALIDQQQGGMAAGWSFVPEKWPDSVHRVPGIKSVLREQVAQKIKQGYAQIEAAHQMMQQVMAKEAAFDKQVAQFAASLRANSGGSSAGGAGSGGGRSV